MSEDIVDRLKERAGKYDEYDWHGAIELEAAAEIERLRGLLLDLEILQHNALAQRLVAEAIRK